jgi:predicted metalloendopeptidase
MQRVLRIALAVLALGSPLAAQQATGGSGIDKQYMDPAVRPQDDLFRYLNGKWLATFDIPADQAGYGSFQKLADDVQTQLKALIEAAALAKNAPGSDAQKVGDFYASYMNQARADSLGAAPIADELAAIRTVATKTDLLGLMARLARGGVPGAFGAGVRQDDKQSDRYIVNLSQGGLGLPDESYYREDTFKDLRAKYVTHVERMLTLAHVPEPARGAQDVMALETRLARSHWTRVQSRDRDKAYNKLALAALSALTPGIDWPAYFAAAGAAGVSEVIVRQPSYFTALAGALDSVPLEQWKSWMAWQVVRRYADVLSKEFVDADFDFYGRTLQGTEEIRPRWKRAVQQLSGGLGGGGLGFAAGRMYVEQHFPPEAKARMQALVKNLIEAYRQSISQLEWMSPETKQRALAKLAKFTPKIGYPDTWWDYAALEIRRDDLVGNVRRLAAFGYDRQLARLGKPVDRTEWGMTPQTVNAYYNASMNEVVFPAAILQPPFFNMAADDAVNYGGIGAVIGHEIGHGFDDQGSKYDGDGNLTSWWTPQDRAEFEKRTTMLIEQYNQFEPLPGQHVNGALTIGENIGDLGGLSIAYKAYHLALGGKEPPVIDGLTGDQRFFLGWAQVWRGKQREQALLNQLKTNSHSPSEFRANGTVRNVPAFYTAFDVKPGDKMYLAPEQRVKIW